ncbi:MAG: AMIN domain-containing protein [Candidatus Magnetomorum sp.]|nr:AMIN domain-containing protein [Candidatus Magnetomorum sp.]
MRQNKVNFFLTLFILSIIIGGLVFSPVVHAQNENSLLMEISSENLYDGSIKVLFILSEVNNPKMFFYKGRTPKVVCDFANVSIKSGLKEDIRVNQRYIKNVRMGEHLQPVRKVRVVLDLVPGKKYSVKEIPPEPNIYSVIIRSDDENQQENNDDSEVTEDSINETDTSSTYQEKFPPITTSTSITTIPPTTIAESAEQAVDTSNESDSEDVSSDINEDEKDTPDEDDIEDEENKTTLKDKSWHERLLKAAEGQEAPNKWPIKTSFGKLKLIAHLDTDPNGFLSLKGYVINMSDDFFYQIQLDFDVFNTNADIVEQVYGEFFNVEPGERRKMNLHIGVRTASNFYLRNKLFW